MKKLGAVIVLALAASTAWAQTTNQGARKSGTERPAGVVTGGTADGGIALHRDGKPANASVPAVSGGVSLNARDAMRASDQNANIKMVFSLDTGNYITDVQVKVTDRSGRAIIDDVATGPWMFARLPAGNYTVAATYLGKTVTQKVSIGKGMRSTQFRWPASIETQAQGAVGVNAEGQILGTGPQEPQQR